MFRETSRHFVLFGGDTVDGRNPANQLICSLSMFIPYPIIYWWFFSSQVVLPGFLNHQKYGSVLGSKLVVLGMAIPPLIGILIMGI